MGRGGEATTCGSLRNDCPATVPPVDRGRWGVYGRWAGAHSQAGPGMRGDWLMFTASHSRLVPQGFWITLWHQSGLFTRLWKFSYDSSYQRRLGLHNQLKHFLSFLQIYRMCPAICSESFCAINPSQGTEWEGAFTGSSDSCGQRQMGE